MLSLIIAIPSVAILISIIIIMVVMVMVMVTDVILRWSKSRCGQLKSFAMGHLAAHPGHLCVSPALHTGTPETPVSQPKV